MLVCCKINNDAALNEKALKISSGWRLEKAAKLKNESDVRRSITAGLLLDYCVLKSGLKNINLAVDGKGKPYSTDKGVFFSLSHSGDYAVCAFSNKPVGVDVQKIKSVKQRVVDYVCSEKEKTAINLSDEADIAFAKFWALKESLIKTAGLSINEVKNTEFDIKPQNIVTGPAGFKFTLYDDLSGYILAVCEKK